MFKNIKNYRYPQCLSWGLFESESRKTLENEDDDVSHLTLAYKIKASNKTRKFKLFIVFSYSKKN